MAYDRSFGDESGAALSEYAIALSILLVIFIGVNAAVLAMSKEKGEFIAVTSSHMTPCKSADTDDVIRNAITGTDFDRQDVCR